MFLHPKRLLALLAVLAMLATGCGSAGDGASSADSAASTEFASDSDSSPEASDTGETTEDGGETVEGARDEFGDSGDEDEEPMDDVGDSDSGPAASDASETTEAAEDAMDDASDAAEADMRFALESDSSAEPSDFSDEDEEAVDDAGEVTSESSSEPEPGPAPQAGLLTAGDVDDNLNYDFFLGYLDRTAQNYGQAVPVPNLAGRFTVEVVDTNGVGLANTAVWFGDNATTVHTDSSGIARFFPNFHGPSWNGIDIEAAGTSVQVTSEELAEGRLVITADDDFVGGGPNALDIALVLDVTGSMSDELRYLTVEFESIVERLERTYPGADLQFGLVTYRDVGDEFVTKSYDFTDSASEMGLYLGESRAEGGGDYPEAMDEAMAVASEMSWREGNVGRVMILNADAPPHDENLTRALDLANDAAATGIRIYPLAASGVGDTAEYLMRVMAATTGGRHMFLTEDSGIGGEKQEPKTQCYQVTNLDSLVLRVLQSELAGERIEPNPTEIIREVGAYDRGVCAEQ